MGRNVEAPCVIFAFRRPLFLQRVLNALHAQDVKHVIAFVDGPRTAADEMAVERCRAELERVDWARKELHFRRHNRGLPGIIENINQVFDAYEEAMFVEEDCLPMPAFTGFMRQALERYRAETDVFSIGGYQPIRHRRFRRYPYSIVSTRRFMCWGWASWRDRWKELSGTLPRCREIFQGLQSVPGDAGADLPRMAAVAGDCRQLSWDVRVAICALWHNKVHLLPVRGLVENIGMRDGAHVESDAACSAHNRNLYRSPAWLPGWVDDVAPDEQYAREMRRFIAGIMRRHQATVRWGDCRDWVSRRLRRVIPN